MTRVEEGATTALCHGSNPYTPYALHMSILLEGSRPGRGTVWVGDGASFRVRARARAGIRVRVREGFGRAPRRASGPCRAAARG